MAILKIRDAHGNVQEILAIRGEDGKNYVLTEADKQEIASMISSGMVSVVDTEAVDAHIEDKNNPHNVTWEQIGAVTQEQHNADVSEVRSWAEGEITIQAENMEALISSHTKDTANPHGVTAEQVGAVTQAELESAVATALNNASIAYVGSATPTNDMGKDGDIYIVSG